MNFVKRFAWVLSLAGLVALSLYSLSGHVFADEHANGVAAPADITLANATRGVIFVPLPLTWMALLLLVSTATSRPLRISARASIRLASKTLGMAI